MEEQIFEIRVTQDLIVCRIFSGLIMYWASTGKPYPWEYTLAAKIFLHNSIEFLINSEQDGNLQIYISTDDELRLIQLHKAEAELVCYSPSPVEEEYLVTFSVKCPEKSSTLACIQTSFTVWRVKLCTSKPGSTGS